MGTMKREILINANPRETRVAILEDDQLVELLVDRPEARRMVGDIYLGRVEAVLPGIQAAFVDIGTEKSAFLHASDLVYPDDEGEDDEDEDDEADGEAETPRGRRRRAAAPPFRTSSSAARTSSFRSPRNRSPRRARASPRRSRSPGDSSSTCRSRRARRREPQDRRSRRRASASARRSRKCCRRTPAA